MNKRSYTVASPLLALSLLSVSGADLAVCNGTDPARCVEGSFVTAARQIFMHRFEACVPSLK